MYGLALTFPADSSVVPVIATTAKNSFTVKCVWRSALLDHYNMSETDRIRITCSGECNTCIITKKN